MLIGAAGIVQCDPDDICGNIGYGVRPLYRKKGYGTAILALALEKARDMGISPITVSCDEENIGSDKVIKNNGGKLIKEVVGKFSGKMIHIYQFS